jgi:UDP-N-acetylmuramoylalanine--D-glutamate ligase
MMELQGKNVLIFGLRRSGRAAAEALRSVGAAVSITDKRSAPEDFVVSSLNPAIKLHLGGHPAHAIDAADLIVVSPGVPLDIPALARARAAGKPVIGEVELGYRLIKAANPAIEFYAVTGTNGKSTTSTLLYHMLKDSGRDVLLAGNIGTPLTGELERARTASGIVLEMSSFQLESVETFSPDVAGILNLAPDHLDRYGSLEDYYQAKLNITRAQEAEDFLVLNALDPASMALYKELIEPHPHPRVFFFGRQEKLRGAYSLEEKIHVDIPGLRTELIGVSDIRIKGVHNLENAMAAALMALLAGARVDAVAGTLRRFPGLEHRMEFVREVAGVSYINDSKGTNPPATLRSIESFSGSNPIVLIAGGRDRVPGRRDRSPSRTIPPPKSPRTSVRRVPRSPAGPLIFRSARTRP